MAETQTNDIDFYAIQRDTQDAGAKIKKCNMKVVQAVEDGDVSRTLDTAIEMRNLGGIPDSEVIQEMKDLVVDKGTDQQMVDFATELAPVLGCSISEIYEYILGLSDEARSKLIGLKALKRQQALQQLLTMFPNTMVKETVDERDNANGIAKGMER